MNHSCPTLFSGYPQPEKEHVCMVRMSYFYLKIYLSDILLHVGVNLHSLKFNLEIIACLSSRYAIEILIQWKKSTSGSIVDQEEAYHSEQQYIPVLSHQPYNQSYYFFFMLKMLTYLQTI